MKTILVFRTLPDNKNNNIKIAYHASKALRRIYSEIKIIDSSISAAAGMIEYYKPILSIGIGSIAMGSSSYDEITIVAERLNVPVVYWLHDDPYELDYAWRVQDKCAWIFTNDRSSVSYYKTSNVSHLPLAASLDEHFIPIMPIGERAIPIFFCGYAYPNRQNLMYRLRHILRNASAQIYGDGWDKSLDFCRNEKIPLSNIGQYYNMSRITISCGRVFNIANSKYEVVASTPGPRTFEAAAAGALQCHFIDSGEIFEYYENKTEILTFNSVDEFEAILKNVNEDSLKYDNIAKASQDRTRSCHTYDIRVRSLINILNEKNIVKI